MRHEASESSSDLYDGELSVRPGYDRIICYETHWIDKNDMME